MATRSKKESTPKPPPAIEPEAAPPPVTVTAEEPPRSAKSRKRAVVPETATKPPAKPAAKKRAVKKVAEPPPTAENVMDVVADEPPVVAEAASVSEEAQRLSEEGVSSNVTPLADDVARVAARAPRGKAQRASGKVPRATEEKSRLPGKAPRRSGKVPSASAKVPRAAEKKSRVTQSVRASEDIAGVSEEVLHVAEDAGRVSEEAPRVSEEILGASEEPAAVPAEEAAQPAENLLDVAQVVGDDAAMPDPTGSLLTDLDVHLFNEGRHHKLWEKLGAHLTERDGVRGTIFGVWAPNAAAVSVIGDFNDWNINANPLRARGGSGIWEEFIPNVGKGTHYKFHITSLYNNYSVDKTDPFGIHQEPAPQTASIVWDLDYEWNDGDWMASRAAHNNFTAPMSIYEVHLGSWRRFSDDDGETWRSMSFREIARPLAEYVKKMNFTHIELLPIMEHPFYGSWGYQCTGFFAPTSRYGTPQDFMYLVDVMHQNGIGVILDWVPSHFPTDEHALSYFDGTHLFEHADPRKGFHPDWNSLIFNYGRNEVRSFLSSSALYWLGVYHADGIRVDAVASMLYLDYSRKHGEWIPNEHGGRENLEAIHFLQGLNEDVYKEHPDVQVIAEESTAWPLVSRPTYVGGLGFGMKWDMGWMHDTLAFFANDPIHRKFHHNQLTFRMMYAFTENFVLPLSHDEVVHGKGSLIGKMPGNEWQKFANLRLLFAHMYSQPAKKLLFMGGEFGQSREWNHDASLDWNLTDTLPHGTLQRWVEDLNKFYRDEPAMHERDFDPSGFEWIDCCDTENSVISLTRHSNSNPERTVVVVLNFTPIPRHNYQVGVPEGGYWREALNSDATLYGGSGQGNMGGIDAAPIPLHARQWSVTLTLPPLGAVFLIRDREVKREDVEVEAAEESVVSAESGD